MAAAPGNERRGGMRRSRNRAPQIPAFGNWADYDQQHLQVPITKYFDYCTTKAPPLHSSAVRAAVYPYAQSYPASTGYVRDESFALEGQFHAIYNYNAGPRHGHFDYNNRIKTSDEEVKGDGGQSATGARRQGRRRSYLDNINRKVFDVTIEAIPTPTELNDAVVVTPALYDVASMDKRQKSNAKDEDLYTIPPELLPKSKPTKKMRKFVQKCFMTMCASN